MAKKSTYTLTTSFKVNSEQKEYIEELKANGINLRDVLEFYKINTTSEHKRLKNRARYLVNHIKELEKELNSSREELIEIKKELNEPLDSNQETMEITEAKKIILERCQFKWKDKLNKDRIADYLASKEADRVLAQVINQYNVKDVEAFKSEILDKIKL